MQNAQQQVSFANEAGSESTRTQAIHAAAQQLMLVAGGEAMFEAKLLALHAWQITPEELVRAPHLPADNGALQKLVIERLTHKPISHILGYRDFWRDRFYVTADVLTPRPDSETVIETLLALQPDQAAPLRILELGVGSGCLILSALREYSNARAVGVDCSAPARDVAAHNARHLGLSDRLTLQASDWCSAIEGNFDVVISNPPYIPASDIAHLSADVRDHEPHLALNGGPDGLDCYRAIIHQLRPHLHHNALVLFEVGAGQADAVAALLLAHTFHSLHLRADLAGIPRVVAARYPHLSIETRL